MTFRVDPDLAAALRALPNQTAFVEAALRDALGRLCPVCDGTGQIPEVHLSVSDFRSLPIRRLDRGRAAQLKALVRLGRSLLATQLELEAPSEHAALGFVLAREDQILLRGTIARDEVGPALAH